MCFWARSGQLPQAAWMAVLHLELTLHANFPALDLTGVVPGIGLAAGGLTGHVVGHVPVLPSAKGERLGAGRRRPIPLDRVGSKGVWADVPVNDHGTPRIEAVGPQFRSAPVNTSAMHRSLRVPVRVQWLMTP